MSYQWDFSFLAVHRGLILEGVLNTFKLAATSIVCGLAIGLVAGAARSARSRWPRILGTLYVEAFRNIPAVVLILWFFFAVPLLTGVRNDRFVAAALALTLYGGAYFAEIYRSGIQSIEKGQWEAARALGFGYYRQMLYIILPQALRRMIPAFTNEAIEMVKLTALASTIAYAELLYDAKLLSDTEYRPVEAYTAIGGLYILLLYVLSYGSRQLERTLDRAP